MVERICTKDDMKKLEGFLKAKKGLLFYHSDADGVCSAALFLKFFKNTAQKLFR